MIAKMKFDFHIKPRPSVAHLAKPQAVVWSFVKPQAVYRNAAVSFGVSSLFASADGFQDGDEREDENDHQPDDDRAGGVDFS